MRVERLDEIQPEKIVQIQPEKLGDRLSANFTAGNEGRHAGGIDGYERGKICGNCEVYIHMEPTNTAFLHAPGSGHDTGVFKESMKLVNDNRKITAVFVVPEFPTPTEDLLVESYKGFLEAYGDTVNVVISGHSGGGGATARAVAMMLEEGYKFEKPPIIVMLDGAVSYCDLTNEQLKLLAENDIPVISYYQNENQESYYDRWCRAGVNMLKIRDYDATDHEDPSRYYFANKDDILDFILGIGELKIGKNGKRIEQWIDGELKYSNEDNILDISEINTMEKAFPILNGYIYAAKKDYLKNLITTPIFPLPTTPQVTTLSINNTLFDSSIDEMITKISNTSYISSNINDLTIGSSSNAISKISDLTSNYYQTTTDLLFSIANELQEFKKISPNIFKAENRIAKKLSELNEGIEFFQYNTPFENEQQELNSNDDDIYLGRQN